MKSITSTIIAVAIASISPVFNVVAGEQQPATQPQPSKAREIILSKKSDKSTAHRVPAKPLIGYYNGSILSFAFDNGATDQPVTMKISADEYYYSINELTQGVSVYLEESDTVELIFADGTTYTEQF